MTDGRRSTKAIDWSLTTWGGNRRAQMERWAAMSLDEILEAQEDMAKISEDLARQRQQDTASRGARNSRA